jgi:hypothetical protein
VHICFNSSYDEIKVLCERKYEFLDWVKIQVLTGLDPKNDLHCKLPSITGSSASFESTSITEKKMVYTMSKI